MSKSRKRTLLIFAITLFSIALLALIGIFSIYLYARSNIDFRADEMMFERSLKWSSTTFYADEDVSDDVYTPIPIETSGGLKKTYYPIGDISSYLKDGFISVEDRIFYEHGGIDVRRTVYAALNYIFGSERTFGASTITQQVVKNVSGDNDISIKRKLSEIIRAVNIEQKYSKDEIFEVYLNVIPMGDNIFGVGLAAREYFGKEPSELSPHEAATLIGITNAPTAYSPYKNPAACLSKRNTVLAVMRDTGVITVGEYERACLEPLSVLARESREDRYDSWFTETVIDDICKDLSRDRGISESAARIMLLGGGYSVYTTMDIKAQRVLEEFFENKENFPDGVNDGLEFSMVVSDSQSGDLRAIVGRVGEKRANRIINHATTPHTPASCLKPLALYAPMIDEGKINWATVFDDVPKSFNPVQGEYVEYPRNAPAVYDGLITVSDAVRLSKNTVAVNLYNIRTGRRIYNDLTDRYGITTLVDKKHTSSGTLTDIAPSPLALGQLSDGIPLRKMAEAYGAFASDGILHKMRSYIYVTDSEGDLVIENLPQQKRIYKRSTAQIMNKLLMQVTENGTARSIRLSDNVDTAGKTGTAGGSLEKMFIGYTPYYTAGIWTGYDGERRAVTSNAHLAVWDSVMMRLHSDVIGNGESRSFSSDELIYRPYCMDSGELYCESCMYDVRESRMAYGYFTPDNAPSRLCNRHVLCRYDTEGKGIASHSCPSENITLVSLLYIPERSFPKEIIISDAEFVYRGPIGKIVGVKDTDMPYFYPSLAEGEYAGISDRRRQFNRACEKHGK